MNILVFRIWRSAVLVLCLSLFTDGCFGAIALMLRPALAIRGKSVNGGFLHDLLHLVPDHQRQQQWQIKDGRQKQQPRSRQRELP